MVANKCIVSVIEALSMFKKLNKLLEMSKSTETHQKFDASIVLLTSPE
jgi:hypothetical protein